MSNTRLVEIIDDAWSEYEADDELLGFAEHIASRVEYEFHLIPKTVRECQTRTPFAEDE